MKFRLKFEYSFNSIDKKIYTYKLSQNQIYQANSNTNQDIRDKAKEIIHSIFKWSITNSKELIIHKDEEYISQTLYIFIFICMTKEIHIELNQSILRPDFFVYFFHTRLGQHRILMNASQVGVPALARPTSTFKEVVVPVPSMNVQDKIMNILHSLDDKIENNRRINENLEQQAQALFKSWFVDFEPFKNGEFVESELGMIPKGWRVGMLGDLLEVKYGKEHKKLADGKIPVYGSGGLMRSVDKTLYIGESVLIPRKGTLNNVMYVNEGFWTVDTMFYTIPKVEHIALYCYLFLSGKDLASMNAGSAVPSMTTEILNNMPTVIPQKNIVNNFDSVVSSYFKKIKNINQESRCLAELRDTLLPKLMSGELKVENVR